MLYEDIKEESNYNILTVENDNNILKALTEINQPQNYTITNAYDLNQILELYSGKSYDILILDFSIIVKSNLKVLKKIREKNKEIYIIIFNNTENDISLKELHEYSIQGYCENIKQLTLFIETATKYIEQMKTIKNINDELIDSKEHLEESYLETIETLKYTVEAKDNYTRGHSDRVAAYSVLIGKKLGLQENELKTLQLGGTLHDIGKIGIPDSILLKKDKLTKDEYNEIKKHTIIGKNILSNASIFQDIIPIVLYHHERYDGKGYPYGISDKEIPFLARIVAVADAFDAMTSERSYRKGLSLEYVKKEIKKEIGAQFDPIIATAFLDILENDYRLIREINKNFNNIN